MLIHEVAQPPRRHTHRQLVLSDGSGTVLATRVTLCNSFGTRLTGLMFRRAIARDEAFLFDMGRSSRWRAAMHTWFVLFPIAIVWLDAHWRVVDAIQASPFQWWLCPRRPARYVIEGDAALLSQVSIGTRVILA